MANSVAFGHVACMEMLMFHKAAKTKNRHRSRSCSPRSCAACYAGPLQLRYSQAHVVADAKRHVTFVPLPLAFVTNAMRGRSLPKWVVLPLLSVLWMCGNALATTTSPPDLHALPSEELAVAAWDTHMNVGGGVDKDWGKWCPCHIYCTSCAVLHSPIRVLNRACVHTLGRLYTLSRLHLFCRSGVCREGDDEGLVDGSHIHNKVHNCKWGGHICDCTPNR